MATMSSQIKHLYEFGPYRLDPHKRQLLRAGDLVPLTPKAVETLIVLVENRDRVVSKHDLMKMLWPDSFVEESNLSQNIFILRKALGDSAQERRYILTVPGRGYQFTEAVQEVVGQDQAQEQEEVLVVQTHSRSELVVEQQSSSLRWLWMGVAVVAVAVGGILISRTRHQASSEGNGPISNIKVRRSVAVLGFRNVSHKPESEWLSTALAEMLSTELAAGDQLRIIPGDEVVRAAHDQAADEADTLTRNSVTGLHSSLDTDYLALGSYVVVGEGPKSAIRLDLRLQNAANGDIVAEDAVSGNESDLSDLIFEAGSRMRERLTVGKTSSEQEAQVRASVPSNPKAARLYAEGLSKLREFEAKSAVDSLTQAAAIEPNSAQIHSALSAAWQTLGYEAKAAAEAKQAQTLSANLRAEDRLAIEGQALQFTHNWAKAIQIYHTLTDLYPDNLIYKLRLAWLQQSGGDSKDSLATLEACHKLPPPIGNDPRIDVAESAVLAEVSNFKKSQQVAAAGAEKAKAQHSRVVLAEARRHEGYALERLGNLDQAIARLSEAKVLFASAGDLKNSATALYDIAIVTDDKGDFEAARRQLEEVLLILRNVGNQATSARALEVMGNVLYEEGKLAEAKKSYEQALAIDRELSNKPGVICSELGNIANVLDGMGDLKGAQKLQEQVLQMFTDAGNKRGAASTESNLGIVLEEQGNLAAAEPHYQHALQMDNEIGYKEGAGFNLYGLADVSYQHDDLKTARDKAEQGMKLRKEMGSDELAAESETQLALIALEQGQAPDAEKFASQVVHQIEHANVPGTLASAYSMLALAQLANGKQKEAQASAEQAVATASKSNNYSAQFDASIAMAQVDAAAGKFSEAQRKLAPVLAQAGKFGYALYLFHARLIKAEIELKSGSQSAARAQFATLEKDANARGFRLIARKAASVSSAAKL